MDIMAIAGLLAAAGLIVYGVSDGGNIQSFINSGAAAVAFGGTAAALMVAFPAKVFAALPKLLLKVFLPRLYNFDPLRCIGEMENLAAEAKRNGILYLEGGINGHKDGFLRKGLQLAVDSEDPKNIREILETELGHMVERHKSGILFFEKGAVYAPGFGLLGTLSGIVNIFAQAEGRLGMNSGIAAALIATFYGLILSNVIFLPLGGKLQRRSGEEVLCRRLIIEGVVCIINGDTPKQTREKLLLHIPPAMRKPDNAKLPDTNNIKRVKNK